jgi:four helix bundle protein
MSGFKDLEIYKMAAELAVKVHFESLKLPKFELYEQGSQIRRSSKSIKDTIAEGYGRNRYKAEFIKYLTYSQASCDEVLSQLETLIQTYPDQPSWKELEPEYDLLGKKINKFITYVESNWKT